MVNILVIRFGSLGDVVLTLPAIQLLRDAAPTARITMSVKKEYGSLFTGNTAVDQVTCLDHEGEHRGFRGLREYADELRKESFDVIVDLHRSVRSRFLTHLLRGPRVFRVSQHRLRRQALVHFKKPLLGYPGHAAERYLAAASAAAGPCVAPPLDRIPHLKVPAGVRTRAEEILRAGGANGQSRFAAIAPGAGRGTKRWFPERFAALARRLAEERSFRVAVIGSDGEADLVCSIVEQAGVDGVFPHVCSDLMLQGALLSRVSALATNDSGLMHLGVAAGTTVTAIFGSTTPSLGFYPLGERDRILSVPMDCRPCSLHGLDECPRGNFACMDKISVDRVYRAMAEIE